LSGPGSVGGLPRSSVEDISGVRKILAEDNQTGSVNFVKVDRKSVTNLVSSHTGNGHTEVTISLITEGLDVLGGKGGNKESVVTSSVGGSLESGRSDVHDGTISARNLDSEVVGSTRGSEIRVSSSDSGETGTSGSGSVSSEASSGSSGDEVISTVEGKHHVGTGEVRQVSNNMVLVGFVVIGKLHLLVSPRVPGRRKIQSTEILTSFKLGGRDQGRSNEDEAN
jgi:hypothetical protein